MPPTSSRPTPLPSFQGATAGQLISAGGGGRNLPHVSPSLPASHPAPQQPLGFAQFTLRKSIFLLVFLVGWLAINTYQPLTSWSICFLHRHSSE